MTEDNERMERANRIREMREGRRTNDDGDDPDASADGGEAEVKPPEAEAEEPAEADDPEADDPEAEDESASPTIDETVDPTDDPEPADASGADDSGAADTGDEPSGFEFEGAEEGESGASESAPDTGDPESDAGDAGSDADEGEGDDEDGTDAPAGGQPDGESDERTTPQSGVAESVSSADAAAAVDSLSNGGTFAIPDQATTVAEDDDQSMLNAEGTVAAARAAAAGRHTAHASDHTRVLEFELGAERFCLDIEYIEEIVELENMTRVPNSPSHVEGVVDLRGQVTAIINPKDALAVADEGRGTLIVVFDSEEMDEQGHLGWVVDEVRQVTPITDDEVNESPDEDDEHINGIINREDEDDFIVWTTPDLALNSSS